MTIPLWYIFENLEREIEIDLSNPKFIQTVWGIGYKFVGEKLED